MTRHDPVEADRIVAHRDPVGHDVNYLKNQEKIPNPTPPDPGGQPQDGLVTHMGEMRQLGWISGGLPGICSR
ncbi:hypothetical protein ACFVIZ_03280 [Streptomyces anulatus]|uniref:hypothetical protein n=1 Tax=Streptomyces anulatus TaxID=1892 RepID=UPI00363F6A13